MVIFDNNILMILLFQVIQNQVIMVYIFFNLIPHKVFFPIETYFHSKIF